MNVFLFVIIELFSLALTVEVLQGKTCQDRCYQERVGHLEPRFQGEAVVSGEYFLVSTKLDTFGYLTVQTAPCYVPSFWHNTGMWQTHGQTDGNAIASTALAMRALRHAVKRVMWLWLLPCPLWLWFIIICMLLLGVISLCTKFEVSSFSSCRDRKGTPCFQRGVVGWLWISQDGCQCLIHGMQPF